MAAVLAHPFRLAGNRVATVDDGSDDGLSQLVAVLVTTSRGERPLVPGYGVTDPAFGNVDLAEVNAGLAMFGPAVEVASIDTQVVDTSTETVTLAWQPVVA